MDSKEEQIAQAMAYVKMVKESGKTCGLMDDLQHMGEDGTDWKEKFDRVCETDKCDMVGLCNEDKCYWESEEKTVNDCLHKYECGCDKQTCMEMDGEEWDCTDTLCGNEYCKHYYDKRNDNCNCNGNDCPYCNNEKEDQILYLLKSNWV